ncbi:homing endonuclease [Salmonella phage S124]|uniref:Homing endonuclease n=1 Tax=Salmonella phage S124 TaxID=2231351 RepID=A0A2Z5HTR0_9CAUD|nr:homing endonuclease [Salmonella phage S124]AXC43108.1 homing endonuclease [Salmonella phage S124]
MERLIYPTKEELEKTFFVDLETGILMRRMKSGKVKIAGTITGNYMIVCYNYQRYMAHIISFILDKGYQPEGIIDHKDGDTLNNRPDNLREASNTQNMCNAKLRKDNSSGFKNVFKERNNWRVRIRVNGKEYSKRGFPTAEAANEYAIKWREELHGDFARHE